MQVYSTALTSLAVTGSLFLVLVLAAIKPVTHMMQCDGHPSYIITMAVCVALDAFLALPFSYSCAIKKRPVRFATIRLVNIGVNIGLNLFFYSAMPMADENSTRQP